MAAGLNNVLKHLRKVAAAENAEQLSDRQLVERFVAESDEAAFAALVQRHSGMVLNVCWRVLQNDSDADDACQATFMVLARKASSIRKKDLVASWLHGVAYRAANNLRTENVRRLAREGQAAASKSRPKSEVTWREVQTILDEEIQRLPEELKGPVLLCYLEGKAHNEGAQQLGWSLTTFRGRLERGREVLRKRLTQRGVALSGALLAAVLSEKAASAAVSGSFLSVLVKGALATETTKGVVSALAQGVMKAMLITRLKTITTVVLVATLIAFGGGLLIQQMAAGQPINARQEGANPASQKADAPNPARGNEEPKKEDAATKQERNKFLGTWQLVSVKSGSGYGITSKEELEESLRARMAELAEAVGFYVVYDGAGMWKQYTEGDPAFSFLNYSGTSEIDPSKEPKTIDYVVTTGNAQAEKAGQNEKGQTKRAIYEFVANETLRVCIGAPGKERPADLSKPDQGQLLWVLQRVKKEQTKLDPDKKQTAPLRLEGSVFKLDQDKKQPAPLHYYPDAKQRELNKQLQDFENELRKKWEKEPDATKAKLLQSGLEHYRERVKAMEEELKKLEKGWKEKGKRQGALPPGLELKGSIFTPGGTDRTGTAKSGHIVFWRQQGAHDMVLASINPDGKNYVQLTNDARLFDLPAGDLALSPAGTLVAYGVMPFEEMTKRHPRQEIRLVSLTKKQEPRKLEVRGHFWRWSPDGKSLLIATREAGAFQHQIIDIATKKAKPLKLPSVEAAKDANGPVGHQVIDWSADGTWFLTGCYSGKGPKRAELYQVKSDGSEVKPIAPLGPGLLARFSPDGKQVLYHGVDDKGHQHLYVFDLARRSPKRCSQEENGSFHGFCWSPDGKRIAYVWQQDEAQRQGGQLETFLMMASIDGKESKALLSEKAEFRDPTIDAPDWR
jgi:RNA polymerase sigma factor (sigma-70 family)